MTKEATGTDFIRDISGSSKSLKRGKRHAAPPARIPEPKAIRNPRLIFPKERAMVNQKPGFAPWTHKAWITSKGPTSMMLLCTDRLTACHARSQRKMIPAFLAGRAVGFIMGFSL
jgi:hypothetical protein